MHPRVSLAAVTDEFSPDLDTALTAMAALGMSGAELRTIGGRNIIEMSDAEVDGLRAQVAAHGMRVLGIASPVLKCELPDGPPIDPRIQRDQFGVTYGFADQPALARRALAIAQRAGAEFVRVFSYWRTVDPARTFDAVALALRDLGDAAQAAGIRVALENEHACNVATGAEMADLFARVDHPAVGALWDPANALVAGETPYPDGYDRLPAARVMHVHVKDGVIEDGRVRWGPVGEMGVGWRGQLRGLARDGYAGALSLETHWTGPRGEKFEASVICGRRLRELVDQSGVFGPIAS